MASRQFIIAGTANQSLYFASAKGLALDEFEYVRDSADLKPLRAGSTVWLVGTYYERKDYDELAELCAARDIGLVRA